MNAGEQLIAVQKLVLRRLVVFGRTSVFSHEGLLRNKDTRIFTCWHITSFSNLSFASS